MLKNIPTSDSMEQVSLRLYFTAWVHVNDILVDLLHVEAGDDTRETEEFLARAQPDLQLSYTLIQQSQEIALKAKICAVSPFLLLLGSDVRTWRKSDADFAQFRTLDASDLVKVVNTICPRGISNQFANLYQSIRSDRNKIYHIGTHNDILDPKELLDILVTQYGELYEGRVWLRDRLKYENHNRNSIFGIDAKRKVLSELPILFDILTNKHYLVLFGFPKKTRRYVCHDCSTRMTFPEVGGTATLIIGKDAVFCHVCEKEYPVRRSRCLNIPCKSNVISSDEHYADHCHLCRKDQKDFPRDDNVIRLR